VLAELPTKTPAMRRGALKDEIGPNKLYSIDNPAAES
jgi:hypothetical protein